MYDENNIFAKILRKEIPCDKVYEDEFSLFFNDINPQAKIHVLGIPKFPCTTFSDFIKNTPGVFTTSSNNFSQDMRISIRGFGARSAFGIRGIKLIVDGIPETTPDGQSQLDNLPLGLISNIEIT